MMRRRMNPLILIAALVSPRLASASPTATAPVADGDEQHSSLRHSMHVDEEEDGMDKFVGELGPIMALDNPAEHRSLAGNCKEGESNLIIDITTDDYGFETSWKLYKNKSTGGVKELQAGPPADMNYDKRQRYVGRYCLPPGNYRFVIRDLFKDGMCCNFGPGKYAGYLNKKKIFSSPDDDEDWERRGHTFTVSSNTQIPGQAKTAGMTARDQQWLVSHNTRRKEWHENNGKSFVPLQWSQQLKDESMVWAEKLADDCDLEHDPDTEHGENIALNYGWGSYSAMRTTDNILSRFVEDEADYSYPDNGHLTQVLWRATKFVGCAEAVRPYDGGKCHAQVCRYSVPGNCNMSRFKSNQGKWWLRPMLMNDSPCGDEISG